MATTTWFAPSSSASSLDVLPKPWLVTLEQVRDCSSDPPSCGLANPVEEGDWFSRWQDNDKPDKDQVVSMRTWLEGLAGDPSQRPSEHSAWPYPTNDGELRVAFLLGSDAFVIYAITDEETRILFIGHELPPGVTFR